MPRYTAWSTRFGMFTITGRTNEAQARMLRWYFGVPLVNEKPHASECEACS